MNTIISNICQQARKVLDITLVNTMTLEELQDKVNNRRKYALQAVEKMRETGAFTAEELEYIAKFCKQYIDNTETKVKNFIVDEIRKNYKF